MCSKFVSVLVQNTFSALIAALAVFIPYYLSRKLKENIKFNFNIGGL
jgi:hypothetical protein